MKHFYDNQDGALATTVVLMVAASLTVFGIVAAFMDLNRLYANYSWLNTAEIYAQADACAQDALARLRNNSGITSSNIDNSNVTCAATSSVSGNIATIVAGATTTDGFGSWSRHVLINVNLALNPPNMVYYKDYLN